MGWLVSARVVAPGLPYHVPKRRRRAPAKAKASAGRSARTRSSPRWKPRPAAASTPSSAGPSPRSAKRTQRGVKCTVTVTARNGPPLRPVTAVTACHRNGRNGCHPKPLSIDIEHRRDDFRQGVRQCLGSWRRRLHAAKTETDRVPKRSMSELVF